ncbi:hypothetical protein [Nonomuraea sp. KM90]|uniref:hypothetical protein n=1 Tax=Nonomuraea sp. KM90 TaxID=3457428 RepID=UPI003FCE50BC
MNQVVRAAAVGLISLAALLPMSSAAHATQTAPNTAPSGEVGTMGWSPTGVFYPGNTWGLQDCNADGKLWGTYQCLLRLSGAYELVIWT